MVKGRRLFESVVIRREGGKEGREKWGNFRSA